MASTSVDQTIKLSDEFNKLNKPYQQVYDDIIKFIPQVVPVEYKDVIRIIKKQIYEDGYVSIDYGPIEEERISDILTFYLGILSKIFGYLDTKFSKYKEIKYKIEDRYSKYMLKGIITDYNNYRIRGRDIFSEINYMIITRLNETLACVIFNEHDRTVRLLRFEKELELHKRYNYLEPTISYPLDIDKTKEYIDSQCTEEAKKIAEIIIENTHHISYDVFKRHLEKCINNFIDTYDKTKKIILIITTNENEYVKSSYWIGQLVYLYLKSKHIEIFDIYTSISFANYAKYDKIDYCNYLFCDDASYSGVQMEGYIMQICMMLDHYKTNYMLHVILPFVTKRANTKISQLKYKNYKVYSDVIMENIYDLYEKNTKYKEYTEEQLFSAITKYFLVIRPEEVVPYYFDHKIADTWSTYNFMYSLGIISFERKEVPDSDDKKWCRETRNRSYIVPFIKGCVEKQPIGYNDATYNGPINSCIDTFYKNREFIIYFKSIKELPVNIDTTVFELEGGYNKTNYYKKYMKYKNKYIKNKQS